MEELTQAVFKKLPEEINWCGVDYDGLLRKYYIELLLLWMFSGVVIIHSGGICQMVSPLMSGLKFLIEI